MGTVTPGTRHIYRRTLRSDAYVVCTEVGTIIRSLAQNYHVDEEQCFDIKVILSELLQNAIRHGNVMDHSKNIDLDILLDDDSTIEITVADEGCGFNVPQTIRNRNRKALETKDVVEMDEFGRGLLIIRSLCDDVHFNHRGNQVTVRKSLSMS